MSAPLHYTLLNDDSREYLETDSEARDCFIELLALLHDLLIPLGTTPHPPRFTADEIFRDLGELVHAFSSESQIGIAVRENISTTQLLHSDLGRNYGKERKGKTTYAAADVDHFVRSLLDEYNLIRVIRATDKVGR